MECKKCGIDLSGKDFRMVAEWAFCPQCFEAIMKKTDAPARESKQRTATVAAQKIKACPICEKRLQQDEGCELLGLIVCQSCYEQLVSLSAVASAPPDDGKPHVKGPMDKEAVEQVSVDFQKTIQCAGCGKDIPAMAGKLAGDKSYCPDCYFRLPKEEAAEASISLDVDSADSQTRKKESSGSDSVCESCLRPVSTQVLHRIQGFAICEACISTDEEMSLKIARARHRKILERIGMELDAQ